MPSTPIHKNRLSVIIPCFNEEKHIGDCLASVAWADEIMVVDSHSTDRSLEIARTYTDRILQRSYQNSADQKNWAIPQATHDWVLIVDCDERVTAELQREIQQILGKGPQFDGYWIGRQNYLFGKPVRYSGWGRDKVLRLFKKGLGRYADKRVHAEIQLDKAGLLQHKLAHFTVDSIDAWVTKINRYSSWKAEDKMAEKVSLAVLQLVLRPPIRFIKDFVFRMGMLDGWRGFLISAMSAFAELVMAAKLMQHKSNQSAGRK